jgi:hypothetical protein
MPGEFSQAGATIGLDAVTGRAAAAARTTYLALLSAAPSDTTTLATMTEVAVAGYARQTVVWTAPTDSAGAQRTQNNAVLTFGPFTADPPNVTHCALVSAASGTTGDFLMFWTLDVAKDAATNESIQFAAGALYMTLD